MAARSCKFAPRCASWKTWAKWTHWNNWLWCGVRVALARHTPHADGSLRSAYFSTSSLIRLLFRSIANRYYSSEGGGGAMLSNGSTGGWKASKSDGFSEVGG